MGYILTLVKLVKICKTCIDFNHKYVKQKKKFGGMITLLQLYFSNCIKKPQFSMLYRNMGQSWTLQKGFTIHMVNLCHLF